MLKNNDKTLFFFFFQRHFSLLTDTIDQYLFVPALRTLEKRKLVRICYMIFHRKDSQIFLETWAMMMYFLLNIWNYVKPYFRSEFLLQVFIITNLSYVARDVKMASPDVTSHKKKFYNWLSLNISQKCALKTNNMT